jgi:high-affinity iron transporter
LLSSFLIALREGVEAALVVGIVLVYLSRTGRARLARFVWSGVAAAGALSLAVALALERWRISQDGFEGLMLLVASVFVITMVVWMNRVARHLRKQIESRVESYAERAGRAAGWGLFFFVFLMVLREGAELALILRAVELSTEGLQTWAGTIAGITVAVAVGLFFFKGTLQVPLPRFFAATSLILMIVAFQLALTGLHELSEARWLPSSKGEMAVIGPIVRNELFFFVFIFGAAMLLVLREWTSLGLQKTGGGAPQPANEAERRRAEWDRRKQRRWMMAAAAVCLLVVMALTADFVYAKAHAAPPEAQPIEAVNGEVRIPLAAVQDGNLHLFTVRVDGNALRFLVIRKPNGWGTALDACRICGSAGYHQDGQNVICRHCASAIYVPSIGDQGGCNPVGVASRVEGADLILNVAALAKAEEEVPK